MVYVKKKLKIIILVGVVVFTVLCILLSVKLYDLLGPPSDEVAVIIAGRIGTEPNWEAIIQYLKDTSIGSSKEQTHERLGKIGLYVTYTSDTPVWDPLINKHVYAEEIHFKETNTAKALGSWIFSYDENGILLLVSRSTTQ
jgi:hypothetical protein